MDTDTLTTPQVATLLGVSLPAAHDALDKYGIPRPGRGHTRTASKAVVNEILAQRGRTPRSKHRQTDVRVLAALSRSPLGLPSVRAVATKAGVSPTTASEALQRLEHYGYVSRREVVVASGRARREKRWFPSAAVLPTTLKDAVRGTRLPTQKERRSGLPRDLHHLFWNADPAHLDPRADGSYLADRLLRSPDLRGWQWALTNLSRSDVERALSRRGVDDRTRALVRNWWAHAR